MKDLIGNVFLALTLTTFSESKRPAEYGKDFIMFPSGDGSKRVVPAYLTKNFTNRAMLSFTPSKKDIHFYLYTADNVQSPFELFVDNLEVLENSKFKRNEDLKILCHGFDSSYLNGFPQDVRAKYLSSYGQKPVNVIVIDWSRLVLSPFYIEAVEHVPWVGEALGKLIQFLVEVKYITLDRVHLIGHSLGAHVVAVAGRSIHLNMDRKLPRITGLDPASPLVENTSLSIDSKVANFVDIIHTDGEFLGIALPLGTVDFYPNGGLEQAGCHADLFGVCSHFRSHDYYLESIVPIETTNSKFGACLCRNCAIRDTLCYQDKFLLGQCQCQPRAFMGEGAHRSLRGLYFLNTNPKSPFSLT